MQTLDTKTEIKMIKKLILDTIRPTNAGHITSSFSVVEILYAIYNFANITKNNIADKLRDRVIISKEHCRLAQVCVLAHLGLLDKSLLKDYCVSGENLGHDMYNIVSPKFSAVDYASGSLGHGASVGAGIAFGDKEHNVYVIIGDGEIQEGSIYEAMIFISQHKISNITLIIDRNNMQIDNYTKNIIDTSSNLNERLTALGFGVIECNGHSVEELTEALKIKTSLPKCIIANTIKGKGVEFLLEKFNFAKFHHSALNDEEYQLAYKAVENEY